MSSNAFTVFLEVLSPLSSVLVKSEETLITWTSCKILHCSITFMALPWPRADKPSLRGESGNSPPYLSESTIGTFPNMVQERLFQNCSGTPPSRKVLLPTCKEWSADTSDRNCLSDLQLQRAASPKAMPFFSTLHQVTRQGRVSWSSHFCLTQGHWQATLTPELLVSWLRLFFSLLNPALPHSLGSPEADTKQSLEDEVLSGINSHEVKRAFLPSQCISQIQMSPAV